MKPKIRIVFTGAQGTGKTTLVNAIAEKYNINTLSIAREQATETGWTPATPGSVEYQKDLYNKLYYIRHLLRNNESRLFIQVHHRSHKERYIRFTVN